MTSTTFDSPQLSVIDGMVKSDIRLDGKTVLITGANTGMGYETALDLARRGARIIMACRNPTKAIAAKAKILDEVKKADLVVKKLDLSSLASVCACAKDVNENEQRLNILINNAGVKMCPPMKTDDGFELHFGTNHIGHFHLTNLLLDLLKRSAPSRIVIVTSVAYKYCSMKWDDVMYDAHYDVLKAHSQSKLANLLHCVELGKILEGSGVRCYAVLPGFVRTQPQVFDKDPHRSYLEEAVLYLLDKYLQYFGDSPKKGAQSIIYGAVASGLTSGRFYVKCSEETLQQHARDLDDSKRLWDLTEDLIRNKTEERIAYQEEK